MNDAKGRVAKAVETGLGTVGRLKILQVLAKDGGNTLTKYGLEVECGLRHQEVVRNLRALLEIGWIEPLSTKPIKYALNLDDKIVNNLVDFFHRIGYT
jgi:hypothetical protein